MRKLTDLSNMNEPLLQLGVTGIIFALAIKEFFYFLRTRKQSSNGLNGAILKELQTTNENHLHDLKGVIEQNNARLIDTIHNDNTKIIELLAEIRGKLR